MRKHADYYTQATVEQTTELDDETLEAVNRALAMDPRTANTLIMVEVHNGEVVLRGETTIPGAKSAAEDAAWSIPGVHSVVNQVIAHGRAAEE